jgi:ABC-2 type transport system permease protein
MILMEKGFATIYWREMVKYFRSKALLFFSLIQPVLWLIIYGLSMSSNIDAFFPIRSNLPETGSINYLTFMAAGVVGMTILFTCLYGGQRLQFDRRYGLMKEIIVSPISRSHVLVGITLSGATKALIQMIIIILFSYVLGVQYFDGFAIVDIIISLLGIFVFALLFSTSLVFLSSSIAMKTDNHEIVQAVITLLSLPLFFASNALYPLESLPSAIRVVSYLNPLAYFINGFRYFSIGSDFYFQGINYSYGTSHILLSLGFLAIFNLTTFLIALKIFKEARDF